MLFHRKNDVATDASPLHIFGTAVGSFHNPRSAPGHDRKAGFGEFCSDLSGLDVVGMVLRKSSGTEDRDAWPNEVEVTKTANQLAEYSQGPKELTKSALRPFQKTTLFGFRRSWYMDWMRLGFVGNRGGRHVLA